MWGVLVVVFLAGMLAGIWVEMYADSLKPHFPRDCSPSPSPSPSPGADEEEQNG